MWVYGDRQRIPRATTTRATTAAAAMGHLVLVGVDGSDGRSGATTSLPETSVRPTTVAAAAAPIRTQMRPRRAQRQRVWNKESNNCQLAPASVIIDFLYLFV